MSDVYLNGQFMPLEQATVPVLDRGFIFGDGVYEVIPVYNRSPLALDRHLRRLEYSLDGIRMAYPMSREEWKNLISELIAREPSADQSLYLHVTRGVAPRDHAFPKGVAPTVFAMTKPLTPPPPSWIKDGVSAITHADFRWLRCDLKTTSLLANVLLRQLAVDAGAAECLLIRDGFLTEGAASNALVVLDGQLLAPPRNHLLLPGITYELVLEVAARHGIPHKERPVTEAELRCAQEVMMTSSTREIVPITRLDGVPVGKGCPGPITMRLLELYQEYKRP
ncbi:MAG: D-amino acid aminotransferase [Betaproteobacteria bacterium]|nr:D-amino acid aminotransferase [Betaproteobacteria bacterium]